MRRRRRSSFPWFIFGLPFLARQIIRPLFPLLLVMALVGIFGFFLLLSLLTPFFSALKQSFSLIMFLGLLILGGIVRGGFRNLFPYEQRVNRTKKVARD